MSRKLVLSSAILIFIVATAVSATDDDDVSAYEAIEEYGFPSGILPLGLTSYKLDRDTGKFEGHWNGTCEFSLEGSYSLRYKSTVTGVVSEKKLKNLKGVSVKVLFFWLDIVEVTRDGDDLSFSVGIASATFPAENFAECPRCGCGFNCPDSSKVMSSLLNVFESGTALTV